MSDIKYEEILKSIAWNIYRLTSVGAVKESISCARKFTKPQPGCPPVRPGGGNSGGGLSWDPNDIYGYLSESGSKFITDSVTIMNYTIEFENDTTFATAPAYKVVVRDTLDSRYFDLATYAPTAVRIGDKHVNLDGSQNFVTTIDLRPEIYTIAQVEGNFDAKEGIMSWTFTSLDPMTMEPATDIMQGFLPVNYNGNGIGEVSYVISKKTGLAHGTEISNRASITFDVNEPIMTPTWTNTIDRVKPVSHITKVERQDDGPTATVSIETTDDGSGPWRYDVYVQYGSGAWFLAAENVPTNTTATVKLYEDIEHHFYCVATDMAGNVEQKEPVSEATLMVGNIVIKGDLTGDGLVTTADVWTLMGIIARGGTAAEVPKADVNGDGRIDIADIHSVIAVMAR